MGKRLLLLTIILLFSQITVVFSQITIGTVDPGPYTPGSSIAVTFTIGSTCIKPGNKFELYLVRPNGTEVPTPIGSYDGFYSTFVNGVIPLGTTPGTGYRIRIKSTTPALISGPSGAFEIKTGVPITAQVSSSPVIGPDMFGFCPGRNNQVFNFTNESTATSTVTGTIKNELTGAIASNLTFIPPNQPQNFTASLAHYTAFIKAQMPDGTVATRAYMIVNNNVSNSFSTSGGNVVCLPGGFLQYGVDVSSAGILNNYPGNTYQVIWGDGETDTYTFCDLATGFIRHEYVSSSCGNPPYSTGGQTIYNVFGINISVISPCGQVGSALSTYVRVVTKPENSFTAPAAACTNSPVVFINNSVAGQDPAANTPICSDNNVRYNWYVNNVLILANVPKSTNFTYTFPVHGVYDIKLESVTSGVCEGAPITQQICIQDPPQPAFDFNGVVQTGCAPFTIQAFDRSVIDAGCNADNTYRWIVNGPSNVQFNPTDKNPVFTFTVPGTYEIILEIQTASCGAVRTQIPQRIILADGAPVATLSADATLCALNTFNFDNVTTGPTRTILSGTQQNIPNVTYTWYVTESDGSALAAGDFSFEGGTDFHSKFPTIKFNQFKTYKIRAVHVNSCGQNEDSQLITFSPSPITNVVANANPICYDGLINLQGSITGGTYTSFEWVGNGGTFSPASGNLTTVYTPTVAERNAGTATIILRVNTGLQGACATVEYPIAVAIRSNNTGTNDTQQICTGTAVSHTPASTVVGSTYSWTVSNLDGNANGQLAGSGSIINDVITNNSTTDNAVVIYTITPLSNGCPGVSYTFTVTVTPRPAITATAASTSICSNEATAITLISNLLDTRYTWTSTVTGSITGNNDVAIQTAATTINDILINSGTTQGTVTYTITPYSATGCAGTPVTVTINIDPAVTAANAGADRSICASSSYTLEGNTAIVGTGVWTLISANGPVTFADPNSPTNVVSGLVPGQAYTFRWTITSAGACDPSSDEVIITVNEPTVAGSTAGIPTVVCEGNNTGTITLSGNIGSVIGWQSSPDGNVWTTIPGINTTTTYTFNNLVVTTYFRAIVQNGQCTTEFSTPTTITVAPATTAANAGTDQVICAQTSVILDADGVLKAGETYLWTITSPSLNAIITDPSNPKSTVTGLVPGQTYTFRWTITGNSPCGPTFDEVSIINHPPIAQNTITTPAVIVCNGQQITIDGSVPSGGSGTYSYTWETKLDAGPWAVISNETSEDLSISLTTTGTVSFRRNITSGSCTSTSNEFPVTVQPPIANNTIAAAQTICSGIMPSILTGSTPTGGDGSFLYQWQSSLDGTTWTNIPGALLQNYQPPILTQTTFYRRSVGTLTCSGTFQSASASVEIKVNPNAKAEYTWTSDRGCAPYQLPITTVPYPDRNATYTWYANNLLLPSTGSAFPGYEITSSNQLVTIKLVVTSSLGCTQDKFEHVFSSNQTVPASFTPVTTSDCGPLTVNFVNTSIQTAGATFRWDFGNGQRSPDANPQPVTFQPDPSGKDTTYIVTLYAETICGINSTTGTVFVKSGPRPVFSPSTTSGCSDLTVNFTNNSPLQAGTTYTFNFGDGTSPVQTTDRRSVTHIYRTMTNTQTFEATLTAQNECGIVTTTPYQIVVRPNTVVAELVVNGDQLRGCAPFTVTFDNNSTGATDFTVDFKDGTQPRQSIIFPERFTHTFTTPGTYEVILTATNGCSTRTTTETITVLPQPLADFSADQTLGCTGLVVQFKNNTQNGMSYIWDFGDGSPTSTEVEPTHTYNSNQEYYTVTLTATNSLGCPTTVSKPQFIHIVPPPVAAFRVNPSVIINIPDYTFNFQDESTNNPSNWLWDFGDNVGTSTLKNPSHTYPDTGTYRVTLRVQNQQGCYTTTFKNVTIKGVPGYLFVPNSFIPGDTRPELREFRAKGSGIQTWRFSIFNKWGQILWETTNLTEGRPTEGWDGTFKGQPLPQGVYYWKIDVQMVNGSEWKGMTYDKSAPKRTGAIHLIR